MFSVLELKITSVFGFFSFGCFLVFDNLRITFLVPSFDSTNVLVSGCCFSFSVFWPKFRVTFLSLFSFALVLDDFWVDLSCLNLSNLLPLYSRGLIAATFTFTIKSSKKSFVNLSWVLFLSISCWCSSSLPCATPSCGSLVSSSAASFSSFLSPTVAI